MSDPTNPHQSQPQEAQRQAPPYRQQPNPGGPGGGPSSQTPHPGPAQPGWGPAGGQNTWTSAGPSNHPGQAHAGPHPQAPAHHGGVPHSAAQHIPTPPQPHIPEAPAALHPVLVNLVAEYDNVVAAYDQGYMSEQDAVALLQALVASDSDGCQWFLDERRQFMRRVTPEAPAYPTDPAMFAVTVTASTSDHSAGGGPGTGRTARTARKARQPRAPRQTSAQAPAFLGAMGAWVRSNLSTTIVAVVGVVLVLATLAGLSGNDDDTDTPAVSTVPVDAAPVTTTPDVTTPDTTTPETVPETTVAPPATPAKERIESVVGALTAGSTAEAAAVVAEPGSRGTQTLASAQWAGLALVGVEVAVDDLVAVDGGYTQAATVSADDGAVLATTTLQWVERDGVFYLASWPALTAAD
jgi:hypothetical protein